ncbi:hypothetical protein QCA50_019505 [Cerrena zonata]|uniref:DUF6535 domain-containing protein n=1 Tax=Cerrena zonata TaxID=2478898 RepID=A0AAW0FH66_9APHY
MNDSDPKPKPDAIQKVQIEPDQKGWARLSDMYHKYDEERIKVVNEDIDALLVFAGLFSAVLSAFVIETYQNLQEDPIAENIRILTQISSQLASLAVTGNFINSTAPSYTLSSSASSSSLTTQVSFVRINTLWSCSLALSLVTASLGILVKQWFHEYMALGIQTPWRRLRIRFFRTEGLENWQVFELAGALPLLLQIALLLFFIGLSEFLRQLNQIVGWATTGVMLAWLATFVFTTIAPLLSSQCPYKTPILKRPLTYLRPRLLLGFHYSLHIPLIPLLPIYYFLRYINCPTTYIQWLDDQIHKIYIFMRKSKHLLEEDNIGQEDANYNRDINIIVSSDSLFQDEQLERTLCECSNRIPISTLYNYNQSLENDGNRGADDSWRVRLHPEAEERATKVVGTMLMHRFQNPDEDEGWSDVLRSIMAHGKYHSYWKHLPTLFISLMQAEIEIGGGVVFLTLYSSSTQRPFKKYDMYQLCRKGMNGDILDNLILITRLVGGLIEFWPRPSGSTSTNIHLRDLIAKHDIKKDLGTFCYTLSMLLHLASPEAIKNRELEIKRLTSDILDLMVQDESIPLFTKGITYLQLALAAGASRHIQIDYHREPLDRIGTTWPDMLKSIIAAGEHGALWEQLPTLFVQLLQADIEIGARAVFLMLYFSSSEILFNYHAMYYLCREGTKGDIVDSLVSITRLVGEHFWPRSSGPPSTNNHLQNLIEEHDIKKDLAAFCYTFSVLLLLTSPEAIKDREEEVRKLTSDILDILNRNTDLLQNPIWTTYLQLDYAWDALQRIQKEYHREAVESNLAVKLRELKHAVYQHLCAQTWYMPS